jgi:hypothetical protein
MNNDRIQAAQRLPLELEHHRRPRAHGWLFFIVGLLLGVVIGVGLALYR